MNTFFVGETISLQCSHCINDGVNGDDGFTGTNFDRPGFQRMMSDVETGTLNMHIGSYDEEPATVQRIRKAI